MRSLLNCVRLETRVAVLLESALYQNAAAFCAWLFISWHGRLYFPI